MPYILDAKATHDIEDWILTAQQRPGSDLSHISFDLDSLPNGLYLICRYATIVDISIKNPDLDPDSAFMEVVTEASEAEQSLGANVWLAPMISSAIIRKILERLEI